MGPRNGRISLSFSIVAVKPVEEVRDEEESRDVVIFTV
jgi:hypothetical protein